VVTGAGKTLCNRSLWQITQLTAHHMEQAACEVLRQTELGHLEARFVQEGVDCVQAFAVLDVDEFSDLPSEELAALEDVIRKAKQIMADRRRIILGEAKEQCLVSSKPTRIRFQRVSSSGDSCKAMSSKSFTNSDRNEFKSFSPNRCESQVVSSNCEKRIWFAQFPTRNFSFLRTTKQSVLFNSLFKQLSGDFQKPLSLDRFINALEAFKFPPAWVSAIGEQFMNQRKEFSLFSFNQALSVIFNVMNCSICFSLLEGRCHHCCACEEFSTVICDDCFEDPFFKHIHSRDRFDKRVGYEIRTKLMLDLKPFTITKSALEAKCGDHLSSTGCAPCRMLNEGVALKNHLWICRDCDKSSKKVYCGSCVRNCHKRHSVHPAKTRNGSCQCVDMGHCSTFSSISEIPVLCRGCFSLMDSFYVGPDKDPFCQSCIGVSLHGSHFFSSVLCHSRYLKLVNFSMIPDRPLWNSDFEEKSFDRFIHWGVECSNQRCERMAIQGIRFHCKICSDQGTKSLNWCRECVNAGKCCCHPLQVILFPGDIFSSNAAIESALNIKLSHQLARITVSEFDSNVLFALLSWSVKHIDNASLSSVFQSLWSRSKHSALKMEGCVLKFFCLSGFTVEVRSKVRNGKVYRITEANGIEQVRELSSWITSSIVGSGSKGKCFQLSKLKDALSEELNHAQGFRVETAKSESH
jgi:hypothetical protein